jgi:Protein of unknown function (DUF4013)
VNSVGDAFAFPFRDPGWAGKVVVQGLILIIPIVGLIATAGWMLMTFDNIRAGRQELAPAGFHLNRGLGLFGAWLIYSFVLALPGSILNGISTTVNANHAFSVNSFYQPGSLLDLAGQLMFDFLLPSIIVMTYHYGFSGGMDVPRVWRLTTRNINNSLVAGLMIFLAGIVGSLGLVACCVGVFFTGAYAASVMIGVASWFERAQSLPTGASPAE